MKIYLKILTLGLFSSLLFGITLPNIWTTGFGQGWQEYNISNENKQSLQISCNVGYDDETDHNIVKFQIMFPPVSHLCFHFFKQVLRV